MSASAKLRLLEAGLIFDAEEVDLYIARLTGAGASIVSKTRSAKRAKKRKAKPKKASASMIEAEAVEVDEDDEDDAVEDEDEEVNGDADDTPSGPLAADVDVSARVAEWVEERLDAQRRQPSTSTKPPPSRDAYKTTLCTERRREVIEAFLSSINKRTCKQCGACVIAWECRLHR